MTREQLQRSRIRPNSTTRANETGPLSLDDDVRTRSHAKKKLRTDAAVGIDWVEVRSSSGVPCSSTATPVTTENTWWLCGVPIPIEDREIYEEIKAAHGMLVDGAKNHKGDYMFLTAVRGVFDMVRTMKQIKIYMVDQDLLVKWRKHLNVAKMYDLKVEWLEENLKKLMYHHGKYEEIGVCIRQKSYFETLGAMEKQMKQMIDVQKHKQKLLSALLKSTKELKNTNELATADELLSKLDDRTEALKLALKITEEGHKEAERMMKQSEFKFVI